jgi:hypothetical protein
MRQTPLRHFDCRIDATVVKMDAANDRALLKAVGQFTPLPVAAGVGKG